MKVLLVNTAERAGGAAIATNRLMHALNNHGVRAKMLVRDKETDDPNVVRLPNAAMMRLRFVAERAEIFASQGFTKENLWAIDTARYGADLRTLPAVKDADLIHLNWTNQGMLSTEDIGLLLATGKPVVWTMHDMWAFTGVCHHAQLCKGWRTDCPSCPLLKKEESKLAHDTFLRKQAAYAKGKIHFVACSDWLAALAKEAPLTQGHCVESIPNAIDTQFFVPGDKTAARKALGLPEDRKLLLFVAYKATDENKGINYLIEATERIVEMIPDWRKQLGVVPVGKESETLQNAFACKAYPQTYVTDKARLRLLYQAADLLVMPTLMDNLPNTIVEAAACGTPCVGFRVGGLPQMITDGINGYLADYRDATHFATRTLDTLASAHYDTLCKGAIRTARENYSEEVVANRYKNLYERCLKAQ